MLCPTRLNNLRQLVELAQSISTVGRFAEFGVYTGDSAIVIAETMHEDSRLYLFDSWEGLSRPTQLDGAIKLKQGDMAVSMATAIAKLKGYNCIFVKGFIEESLRLPSNIIYAHVDVDLYGPTKIILEKLIKQKVPLITIDDYCPRFPGVMAAVNEFLALAKRSEAIAGAPDSAINLYF